MRAAVIQSQRRAASKRRGRPRAGQQGFGKRRILDAATRLFQQYGITPVSVENIIAVAGVSKMGFYYHYQSKHDLVVAFLEREARRTIAYLRRLSSHHDVQVLQGPLARFLQAASFHGHPLINTAIEHPSPELRRMCAAYHEQILAELQRFLPATASPGARLQSLMILEGLIVSQLVKPDDQNLASAMAALQAIVDADS